MEKWMLKNIKYNVSKFAAELNTSEVVARLLINRGIFEKERAYKFLNPTINELNNPRNMKDLSIGVQLIKDSIEKGLNILVVGDYDVDGVISTYLLYTSLQKCGAKVEFHIPDRITEGYGINESIIRNARANGVDVIITCDNGISAIEQVKLAKELGIKVIITDHHDIPFIEDNDGTRKYVVPQADAIINPKQKDCMYPCKFLCGAGVVFKFIQVLLDDCGIKSNEVYKLLQYVAIATVCDVVDLIDENKIFVKNGLKQIKNTDNIGLKALLRVTELTDKEISVYAAGFIIGPCINASSRLEQAIWALKLLLTEDKNEAEELANKLYELNKKRQELTNLGLQQTVEMIESCNMTNDKVLVAYIPEIHESIAGIIAGRIREKYNLPSIVLTKAQGGAKGSGRSIEEYNMFEELLKCKDILGKFGGHPMAAGLSIEERNIELLREELNHNCTLTDEDILPKVVIDLQLPFNKISLGLAEEISGLEPFGKGNSKPLFGDRGVQVVKASILGKNNNVLKLKLKSRNAFFDGIMFERLEEFQALIMSEYGELEFNNLFNRYSRLVKLDLVFSLEINEYMGNKNIQLQIKSFRKSN